MWWPLLSGHMVVYTSLYALEKSEQALLAQLWKSPKTESWLFAYINGTLKPILNNLRKLEPSLLDDSHLWDVFSPFQVTNRPATKTSHHTITVYQRSLPSQKSRTHRTLFWVMRLHFFFFFCHTVLATLKIQYFHILELSSTFFQTMSIKLIACSSEFCSAHGNNIICFKVFSMGAEGETEPQQTSPQHRGGVGNKPEAKQVAWVLWSDGNFDKNSRCINPKPYCCADWYVFLSDMNDVSGTLIRSLNSNSRCLKYSVLWLRGILTAFL